MNKETEKLSEESTRKAVPKIQDFKKEFADSFADFLEIIRAQREKPCHICGLKPETGCCKDLDGITRHDFFDGP
jgi:hypothetical protein